jgi:hypothetical protein
MVECFCESSEREEGGDAENKSGRRERTRR